MVKKGAVNKMNELRKTKEEFFVALAAMLRMYQSFIAIGMPAKEACDKTLESYDDFYEWLLGDLDEQT